ncbi:Transmembrane amino acid transporter family protein [Striga hermonthica]|uniref:Transmembrane amino acid transporter family protein n=1 Tax=Striga hermonthica TaxID=68872 RepID=A0A9N7MMA3_STRHE|nr:Transmembrane amino acid transporter family protein [Striga hermonthica]
MKREKQDSGVVAPLLPEFHSAVDKQSGASISGAVFNISTGMVGAGIMSIPATFKVLGVFPSFLVILVIAYFVEVTVEFLLKYTRSGESDTYGGLMEESFGKFGSIGLQVCVVITNLGALIIYLIIIGDVLSGNESGGTVHLGILQEWFGIRWWNSRAFSLLFIVLLILLPLLLLRRMDSLRHASAISVFLAAFFVAICSVMAIHAMWAGKTQRPRLFPHFTTDVSAFDLFTTIPIFATAFGCHVNIHPIRSELGRAADMKPAVRISLVLCVAIYFAVGFFGYLLFGDSIMADMLVNFDKTSDSVGVIVNDTVRLSYAIHLMLVFPVMNYSLRANVAELFFPKTPLLARENNMRFLSLTCILLAFIYVAAIAIPDIWIFFQFMGTTTVMCLMFIFPSSIVLRDVHGMSNRRDKVFAVLVIFLAVGTSLIAVFSNFSNFLVNK